jgi:hypothetical protein
MLSLEYPLTLKDYCRGYRVALVWSLLRAMTPDLSNTIY